MCGTAVVSQYNPQYFHTCCNIHY